MCIAPVVAATLPLFQWNDVLFLAARMLALHPMYCFLLDSFDCVASVCCLQFADGYTAVRVIFFLISRGRTRNPSGSCLAADNVRRLELVCIAPVVAATRDSRKQDIYSIFHGSIVSCYLKVPLVLFLFMAICLIYIHNTALLTRFSSLYVKFRTVYV